MDQLPEYNKEENMDCVAVLAGSQQGDDATPLASSSTFEQTSTSAVVDKQQTVGKINKCRPILRAYRKPPHHTLLKFPIGHKGPRNDKCISFGTTIDKTRHTKYHVVSITSYNPRYENCGRGVRLFIPQFEEVLNYKKSISAGLQDVSHGADIIFKMQLGSGIKVSINLETGNLDFQHYRGQGREKIATDISISLDKDEWENLITHENVLLEKFKLHKNDAIAAPYNDLSNEHLHRAL